MTRPHVILGSGQVGPLLARRLVEEGKPVRVVRRSAAKASARSGARSGVETVQADLTDPAQAIEACTGAEVIYDCTNPASYASWHRTLEPLKDGVFAAARATGAFLVTLDNLYMYGQSEGPMSESSPVRPCSTKGELRARIAGRLLEAFERGEIRGSIGRAADFFGPGAGAMSLYGEPTIRSIAAGSRVMVIGDPTLPRSYSYVPDVVRGLATLGAHTERSEGQVFHLPVAHKTESSNDLVAHFAGALDVPPRTYRLGRWFFRLVWPFSRDIAAVGEMLYQWEKPFVVDDSRFVETFGIEATPIARAVEETLEAAGLRANQSSDASLALAKSQSGATGAR